MLSSLRSALLVVAAVSASSVAPAKVGDDIEPLIPAASASLPTIVVPQRIPYPVLPDAAEPAGAETLEPESAVPEPPAAEPAGPARPAGDLASLVAGLRGDWFGWNVDDASETAAAYTSEMSAATITTWLQWTNG